ncbi:PepSY domain-containing protein [Aliiroseovarius sp. PTFE2010]|uniref:PepSY domain-containing protein n=1 Tax=Aliiroseovarius sp. PTFE2010 TaxID=3417190 RepID=UPI003CED38B9
MKVTIKVAAFIGAFAATTAFAQSASDQVIRGLQEQGFTRVEVRNGATQMKVEAIRNNQKVELVYDLATGDLLKQEVERVGRNDNTTPGVEVRSQDRDFVRADDDDDDDDDDYDDDHDDDDDDGDDHDDDGDDHDADDDHDDDDGDDGDDDGDDSDDDADSEGHGESDSDGDSDSDSDNDSDGDSDSDSDGESDGDSDSDSDSDDD